MSQSIPVHAPKRLFTVQEFHRMADASIFDEDDRVELLRGEIVEMTPIGARHAACVSRLNQMLTIRVGAKAIVRVQDPLRLDDYSEPQPDVVVVRPRDDFYRDAHPGPDDVLLVIEVADTSAEIDRTLKLPVYAAAAIAEVWVVDLGAGHIDVYRDPQRGDYAEHQQLLRPGTLRPFALPDIELDADIILK